MLKYQVGQPVVVARIEDGRLKDAAARPCPRKDTRILLARQHGQRAAPAATPHVRSAAGVRAQLGSSGAHQRGQIGERLFDAEQRQIVEVDGSVSGSELNYTTNRRIACIINSLRGQIEPEETQVGGDQGAAQIASQIMHQTALDPLGGVRGGIVDENEQRSTNPEVVCVVFEFLERWVEKPRQCGCNSNVVDPFKAYKCCLLCVLRLEMIDGHVELADLHVGLHHSGASDCSHQKNCRKLRHC